MLYVLTTILYQFPCVETRFRENFMIASSSDAACYNEFVLSIERKFIVTPSAADIQHAADVIRAHTSLQPGIGLVLGSGLGPLADTVEDSVVIPYAEIPGFPISTVFGHAGELVIGHLEGRAVVVQRGRVHYYEGYSPAQITFPLRVMRALGIETVILTNAAGGINRTYHVGDIMTLVDHINFIGLAGHNPLVGPNDDSLGLRFPGMAQAYDRRLRELAAEAAQQLQIPLRQGVYAGVSGPMFETPAEIRMLRSIGADAVGMSTVHETLVARHGGMRVLAFSSITNICIDQNDAEGDANHEEVLEASKVIAPRMTALLRAVMRKLED